MKTATKKAKNVKANGKKKIWIQLKVDVSWENKAGKKDLIKHLKDFNSSSVYAGDFRIQSTKSVKLPKF